MKSINENIIKLWEKDHNQKRSPNFYPDLKNNALLFIGLNPSFSEKGLKQILKDEQQYSHVLENIDTYFNFNTFEEDKIEVFKSIGLLAKAKYPYFKKFADISKELNIEWEHIDLLFERETNQKLIEKKITDSFCQEQIKLSIELISIIEPKIIVIENAFASKVLKKFLELKWNDKLGTYLTKSEIPVFLSGMLTGQRALDNGSYERLLWHLKSIKNTLNNSVQAT